MTSIKGIASVLLVALLTLPAAIIHGRLTNRWQQETSIVEHASRIDQIPMQLDEWRLVDELPELSSTIQKELGIRAHVNRVYENDTGKRVTVLVMIGESGPLVRHPIEICYGNRAKQLVSSHDLIFESEPVAKTFKVQRYEPKSVTEDEFYVAYAFCSEGSWNAPNSPRMAYGGKPVLYKMQVLTNAESTPPDQVPEHLREFVERFATVVGMLEVR
jgi:hypothetical protein